MTLGTLLTLETLRALLTLKTLLSLAGVKTFYVKKRLRYRRLSLSGRDGGGDGLKDEKEKMMRKTRLALLGVMALLCCLSPLRVHAFGKGEKSVGVMGGFATYNNGGYVDVNFQWEFAEHFRLSPDVGCVFQSHDKSAFMLDVDMQFPFRLVKGFGVYPLVGLAYNSWRVTQPDPDDSFTLNRVGGNVGLGFDLYFTRNLKMQVQGKYSWMKDTGGAFFGLGLSYVF